MGRKNQKLNIFFFPFLAYGHMIPALDMAKLFAARGVKTTIITTPLNAPFFSKTIQRTRFLAQEIHIETIEFPSKESGLFQGCENVDSVPSQELVIPFYEATATLREPLEQLLGEHLPTCLVADMFFPWTTDAAAKFGIPRIVFHGMSFLSLSAWESIRLYEPHNKVLSDSEPFLIPNLPSEIKLTRFQLPEFIRQNVNNSMTKLLKEAEESGVRSYGVVVNSFYELEPAFADHYKKVLGVKAWQIGPFSLSNKENKEKSQRGVETSIDEEECLNWLNSKKPNSVVYVSFGSIAKFSASQLVEIALGLEASGQQFIWVVRCGTKNGDGNEDWLPEGFEERMEGKGLVIRGWAPQLLILDHEAVGAFVTHCGWNSTLEGVCAGVPMVTWPVFADHFFNEKLLTQVLKVGVGVGVQKWVRWEGDSVKREAVAKAVKYVMEGGEEIKEMRKKARALGVMAKRAVEEGGSSYSDLSALIEELRALAS
ncbi:scopoletin glucosyltransferase-like [Ziziphus jujuba]|uniref:Glycosyltransferase n=1 Tax=Ziziphus jujuba TaxID=326968 RepID=A0A6P4ACR7_ZIZJJ|nr:scopoletin glucosyltransferase-like [Ziziphus jujuba]